MLSDIALGSNCNSSGTLVNNGDLWQLTPTSLAFLNEIMNAPEVVNRRTHLGPPLGRRRVLGAGSRRVKVGLDRYATSQEVVKI
eukprot:CAMPEP_0180484858 /NCGR_PEP_ID=MMETSP1036_2-20121128/36163_1 /TAXON_ID=632150 /ORGANISM="Azadinium spinosum, Strain 3D9" /LENGTH=83 /DNA_ID=CAMNT_0022492727 /DNA_START=588 /DNA_END=839 /DNA_ORIENTATION=-